MTKVRFQLEQNFLIKFSNLQKLETNFPFHQQVHPIKKKILS